MAYFCIITAEFQIADSGSLKSKRKQVSALKAKLEQKFSAAVSETGFQDLWQRVELTVALAGSGFDELARHADAVERYIESEVTNGARIDRSLLSVADIR